jgi:hypothetical protein
MRQILDFINHEIVNWSSKVTALFIKKVIPYIFYLLKQIVHNIHEIIVALFNLPPFVLDVSFKKFVLQSIGEHPIVLLHVDPFGQVLTRKEMGHCWPFNVTVDFRPDCCRIYLGLLLLFVVSPWHERPKLGAKNIIIHFLSQNIFFWSLIKLFPLLRFF